MTAPVWGAIANHVACRVGQPPRSVCAVPTVQPPIAAACRHLSGATDEGVLAQARADGRIVITADTALRLAPLLRHIQAVLVEPAEPLRPEIERGRLGPALDHIRPLKSA